MVIGSVKCKLLTLQYDALKVLNCQNRQPSDFVKNIQLMQSLIHSEATWHVKTILFGLSEQSRAPIKKLYI